MTTGRPNEPSRVASTLLVETFFLLRAQVGRRRWSRHPARAFCSAASRKLSLPSFACVQVPITRSALMQTNTTRSTCSPPSTTPYVNGLKLRACRARFHPVRHCASATKAGSDPLETQVVQDRDHQQARGPTSRRSALVVGQPSSLSVLRRSGNRVACLPATFQLDIRTRL